MAHHEKPRGRAFVAPDVFGSPHAALAEFVLGASRGSVVALGGIDGDGLRAALDAAEPEPNGRRAVLARVREGPTAEAVVEQIIAALADSARLLWPTWYNDVTFPARDDALGRLAAIVTARVASRELPGLSPSWTKAAARRALAGRPPRVPVPAAVEIAQLGLAISRFGLVFVADVAPSLDGDPFATVHALEWTARHLDGAVVALFSALPPNEPPFDRILYGARSVLAPALVTPDPAVGAIPWIAPWRGSPHPGSEIEQRLARALGEDAELAPLFVFNQSVVTVRGSRPRVDLLWSEGRLAVEIDGYGSHGNPIAFMQDRQRDYELVLSGYTVLRLTNDEIAQDVERAIEKIRDLVTLCRGRTAGEAGHGAHADAGSDTMGVAGQAGRREPAKGDQAGREEV